MRSPRVRCCIFPPRAARLYLMRLDGVRVSLLLASSPPAPDLTAGSCSCDRGFAFRFLQLHLAATPCGSARVDPITSLGIFHPLDTAHVGRTSGGILAAEQERRAFLPPNSRVTSAEARAGDWNAPLPAGTSGLAPLPGPVGSPGLLVQDPFQKAEGVRAQNLTDLFVAEAADHQADGPVRPVGPLHGTG